MMQHIWNIKTIITIPCVLIPFGTDKEQEVADFISNLDIVKKYGFRVESVRPNCVSFYECHCTGELKFNEIELAQEIEKALYARYGEKS